MGNLTSYSTADFIPFTAEVYFRLIERVSETWWPLHLLTLCIGLSAAALAWTGRARAAGGLLAAAMAWVGVVFLFGEYAQLNWAGTWFGWAFVAAAALLLLFSTMQSRSAKSGPRISIPGLAGLALVVLGVPGYPLIAPLAGLGWSHAETFGIHPDPTAVAALGIALIMLRGYRIWLVAVVPALWCLVSALTLQVLQAAWAGVLYAVVGVALFGMIWSSVGEFRAQQET